MADLTLKYMHVVPLDETVLDVKDKCIKNNYFKRSVFFFCPSIGLIGPENQTTASTAN